MYSSLSLIIPQKLDGLLISNRTNLGYLTNFWGSFGYLFITAKKQVLLTDSRYLEEAKKIVFSHIQVESIQNLEKYLNQNLKIGYESNYVTVSEIKHWQKKFPKISFRQTKNLIEKLRIQKNEKEIELIQQSAQITDQVLTQLKPHIKLGVTEKELKHKIIPLALGLGAEKMAFDPIVSFGKNSSKPHHEPDESKLKKGEIILIDLGVRFQRYCSDLTRVFFTSPPNAEQNKVFEIVLNAQLKAQKEISVQAQYSQIDQIARTEITQAGFGDYFGHSLGHGVGLEIHESPNLSTHNNQKILNRTVFSIEPGIYLPGKFGIRLEDLFCFQENKLIRLSTFSKKIEDLILKI